MKRWLSGLLVLVMLFTAIPTIAEDAPVDEAPQVVETVETKEEAPAAKEEPAPEKKEETKKEAPAPEKKEEKKEEPAAEKPEEKTEAPAAEEKPAEEEKKAEEPAEEKPAEPVREEAAEPETKQEEAPAEEQQPEAEEEKPAEEKPAEAQKPEQEEEAPAEAPEAFSKGYALIKADTKLYAGKDRHEALGTLKADAVVYVTERDENTGSLSLVMAIEGEALEAWVSEEDAVPLTEEEIRKQEALQADLIWKDTAKLVNAEFEAKEAPAAEQPVEEVPQEEPAQEGSEEEVEPAEDKPEEAAPEAPAQEPEEEDPNEEVNVDDDPAGLSEEDDPALPWGWKPGDGDPADESETAPEEDPQDEDGENPEEELTGEEEEPAEEPAEEPLTGEEEEPAEEPLTDEELEALLKAGVPKPDYFEVWCIEPYPQIQMELFRVSGVHLYEIQRREIKGSKWTSYATVTTLDSGDLCPKWVDAGTEANKVYQYRVRAILEVSGVQSKSKWKESDAVFTTGEALTVHWEENPETRLYKLTWNQVAGATGYYVVRYDVATEKASTVKNITKAKTVTFTDTKVQVNKKYEYGILPYKKIGSKIYTGPEMESQVTDTIQIHPLGAAPVVTKLEQVTGGVQLTWTTTPNATGYAIYRSTNPYASKPTWKKIASTTNTTYTHKDGLKASKSGVHSQYKVVARGTLNGKKSNGYNVTGFSDIFYRMANANVTLKKVKKTEDAVKVTWPKVKNAEGYYLHYYNPENGWTTQTIEGNKKSNTYTIYAPGTKESQVYVEAYTTNPKTGAHVIGSPSATKKITPYWYRVLVSFNNAGSLFNESTLYDAAGLLRIFKNKTVESPWWVQNATSASYVESAIEKAFGNASKNTVCIFCYSGHGNSDVETPELDTGALVFNGAYVEPATLKAMMDRKIPSEHVVLLINACGSGGLVKGDQTVDSFSPAKFTNAWMNAFGGSKAKHGEFGSGGKYSVIAAAEIYYNSFGASNWYGLGLFSWFMRGVCRGCGYDFYTRKSTGKLADGKGGGVKDKNITVYELYSYVKDYAYKNTTRADGGPQVAQIATTDPNLIIYK